MVLGRRRVSLVDTPSKIMSHFLKWPDEFADPPLVTDFGAGLVDLLNELRTMGVSVHADLHWSLFGFQRGPRLIDFVRRGRSRSGVGGVTMNREMYWEVWPECDGRSDRLGPYFGLKDFACIVICGLVSIRNATIRWLDHKTIPETIVDIECWHRSDTLSPLRLRNESGANKAVNGSHR